MPMQFDQLTLSPMQSINYNYAQHNRTIINDLLLLLLLLYARHTDLIILCVIKLIIVIIDLLHSCIPLSCS